MLQAAFLAASFGAQGCSFSSSEAAVDAPPPVAARVEVVKVSQRTLTDRWVFLGEVRATTRARLSAGAVAEVQRVGPRVGDRVETGEELVMLDVSLARAQVAAARASKTATAQELAQAERDRARARQLGASILAEAEIERDETRARSLADRTAALRAAERQAKAALSRHRVIAPFAGVIAERFVEVGDWVSPGDPVVELFDDTKVEVWVAGSEALLAEVAVGDRATIVHGQTSVVAEVAGVVRALDPVTRTGTVRLIPDDKPNWMLPGTSLDVEFSVVRDEPGVVVPRDALVYGAVGTRVVRVVDGVASPLPVTVIATVDDAALVRGEGLLVDDEVVVRGNERLRPGQAVQVVASRDE